MHGGKAPQVQRAVERRRQEEAARRAVVTYGLPRDVDPYEALREEIVRTAGHVAWLGAVVATLPAEDLVFGVERSETGAGESRLNRYQREARSARPSVWLTLYQAERSHLVNVCKAAIACGLVEREVCLAEQQGQLLADVLRAVFDDPALGLTAKQHAAASTVASQHLRVLTKPIEREA
jgi:hypothetical protein